MVGTPINQVRRVINQGLIKDLISPLLYCEGWLLMGVVAQWQSTARKVKGPGFDSRQLHLSFLLFRHFKGPWIVMARLGL